MLYDAAQLATAKKTAKSYNASNKAYKDFYKKKKAKAKAVKAKAVNAIPLGWRGALSWKIGKIAKSITPSPAEDRIRTTLNGFKFDFHYEVSFKGLVSEKKFPLRFDFWIPSLNLLIEYDGKGWHSTPERKANDKLKNRYCKYKKLTLVRYNASHWETLEETIIKQLIQSGLPE